MIVPPSADIRRKLAAGDLAAGDLLADVGILVDRIAHRADADHHRRHGAADQRTDRAARNAADHRSGPRHHRALHAADRRADHTADQTSGSRNHRRAHRLPDRFAEIGLEIAPRANAERSGRAHRLAALERLGLIAEPPGDLFRRGARRVGIVVEIVEVVRHSGQRLRRRGQAAPQAAIARRPEPVVAGLGAGVILRVNRRSL
jgi:hypothetical protein